MLCSTILIREKPVFLCSNNYWSVFC